MPNTPEELGKLIRKLRREKDWTQSEIAEKLGVTKSTVTLYEKGHNNFTVVTLQRIANALGAELSIEIKYPEK